MGKLKIFWRWLTRKSEYVKFEDYSDCYTAMLIQKRQRKIKL